jgi:hypothetical protein
MSSVDEFLNHFWPVLVLIALALILTLVVFRRRWFERGYRKGEARDPDQVRRENPPDQWSSSR